MHEYDLICIGCGPAGEKAATQAAYFGHRVAIVERAVQPGGAMVNTGTVPSKALRETALLCSSFNRRPLPGMEFKIDHRVSIAKFMARRLYIEQQEHDRIESSMDRHGIAVHRGHGRIVDPHTVQVQQRDGATMTLKTRHILIATGSSPLRPDNIPFDDRTIVDADSVLNIDHIPGSMIIVGGGVIGCEYASIFAEIDVDVTLVHRTPPVLPFIDPECRQRLEQTMRDQGVRFEYGSGVERVDRNEDGSVGVTLDNARELNAEMLLWAAGRISNTDGLGLEDVGVETDARGQIVVNDMYQTSVPSIYAAGDIIGFPALAATSMEQGRIAACNMFGIEFKQKLASIMPIGLYTVPAISTVGLTAAEARDKGIDVVIGRAPYSGNVRGRMLGDAHGLLKCVFERATGSLLGACIVGESATELIHIAMDAIANGTGIDEFVNACYNYPSLSELYKYAAYSALQAMNESSSGASTNDDTETLERVA